MDMREYLGKVVSVKVTSPSLQGVLFEGTREVLVLDVYSYGLLGVPLECLVRERIHALCLSIYPTKGLCPLYEILGVADGRGVLHHVEQELRKVMTEVVTLFTVYEMERATYQFQTILNLVADRLAEDTEDDKEEECDDAATVLDDTEYEFVFDDAEGLPAPAVVTNVYIENLTVNLNP